MVKGVTDNFHNIIYRDLLFLCTCDESDKNCVMFNFRCLMKMKLQKRNMLKSPSPHAANSWILFSCRERDGAPPAR